MDFRAVLERLIPALEARGVNYAVIGGFALALWGVPRTTVDLDFLVRRDDLPTIDEVLQELGYQRLAQTDNVSHYRARQARLGIIDLLHAYRAPSLRMLAEVEAKPIFGGDLHIPTIRPEHLIGYKVQAIKNNPARRAKDWEDIRNLANRHRGALDWELVAEYFALFAMSDDLAQLRTELEALA